MNNTVICTDHAIYQYSARLNDHRDLHKAIKALGEDEISRSDLTEEEIRYFRQLRGEILACVRRGLAEGRVFDHKPQGFVMYHKKNRLPERQRFVQCSDDHGFVLKQLTTGEELIVTCLSRVGVRR